MKWLGARSAGLGGILVITLAIAAVLAFREWPFEGSSASRPPHGSVMLILRGIASAEKPRGQLDDASAREFAQRLGYRGEVLDVPGNTGADSMQVKAAIERIRGDTRVRALYGFSGGGYNARTIWKQLSDEERARIRTVVVVGSPGVSAADFPGSADVHVEEDPPEGHMAGPKVLLEETVGRR